MNMIIFIIAAIVLFTAGLWAALATYVVLWVLTGIFWSVARVPKQRE